MILWSIITLSLLGGSILATKGESRLKFASCLLAWAFLTLGLRLLGGPTLD